MNAQLYPRLGTFFILVGCGLLILFFGSAFAGEFNIFYLLFAAATLFLGFMFHRLAPHPEPQPASPAIRKVSQRSRQRQEEKQPEEDHEK